MRSGMNETLAVVLVLVGGAWMSACNSNNSGTGSPGTGLAGNGLTGGGGTLGGIGGVGISTGGTSIGSGGFGTGGVGTGIAGTGIAGASPGTGGVGTGGKGTGGMGTGGVGTGGMGTGGMGTGGMGTGGSAAGGATFTAVYAILMKSCAGADCHVGATRVGAGLSMSDKATAYTNLVGAASMKCTGQQRVVASNPTMSVLVQALEHKGGCAPNMPERAAALSATDIATITSWIMAGAKND